VDILIKTNLPVILLKGIILLPNNEIRLEFDNDESKNIIYVSEMFHDNKLLVVSTLNLTTSKPEIDKLPKNKWKWFDAKQETCHLFGIIFYLLGATKNEERGYYCDPNNRHLDKNVCLYNVIWKFNGEEFDVDYENSLPGIFEKKAKDLVNKCIKSSIQFDFKILEVHELLKETNFHGLDFTKAKAYGLNRLLENQMKQYENNQRGGLENTSSL
jgi:hypothetical protein